MINDFIIMGCSAAPGTRRLSFQDSSPNLDSVGRKHFCRAAFLHAAQSFSPRRGHGLIASGDGRANAPPHSFSPRKAWLVGRIIDASRERPIS